MMAAFVRPTPPTAGRSRSAARSGRARRRAPPASRRSPRSRRARPRSWTSPSWPLGAVPEVALDLLEERRGEAAKALLRAELEDAVRLEPRRLGLVPVARRRRGLKAVERRRDDVEVGGLRGLLPRRRIGRSDEPDGLLGRRPHGLRRATAVPREASARTTPSSSSATPSRCAARGTRLDERRLDVVERRRCAVAERDCLLDLEVERHAAVLYPAAVLDGHEPEEPLELPGAPGELLVGERRSAEAGERALDAPERRPGQASGRCGGRHTLERRGRASSRLRRRAARGTRGQGSTSSRTRARPSRRVWCRTRARRPRAVRRERCGAEHRTCPGGRGGRPRQPRAASSPLQRGRRGRPSHPPQHARNAWADGTHGRGASCAPCSRRRVPRRRVACVKRGREDRRPHGAPGGRERALVAVARGTLGDSDRRARVSQCARARGEDCVERADRRRRPGRVLRRRRRGRAPPARRRARAGRRLPTPSAGHRQQKPRQRAPRLAAATAASARPATTARS